MPEPTFTPVRTITCARCGATFGCGLTAECWCASTPARLPLPLPLPNDKPEDCLCPECLRRAAGISDSQNTPR